MTYENDNFKVPKSLLKKSKEEIDWLKRAMEIDMKIKNIMKGKSDKNDRKTNN